MNSLARRTPAHHQAVSPSANLRAASASAHAAAERCPLLAGLARGDLTDADYARAMGAFAALFNVIVDRIGAKVGGSRLLALSDFEARAARARADARTLGGAERADRVGAGFIQGDASALGALYVLEGSRLGGVVIASALRAAGRDIGGPGYTFFDPQGLSPAATWRAFAAQLDKRLTNPWDLDVAVMAACGGFDMVETLFGES